MQKDLSIGILNEIYGYLLTPHQREIIVQYFDYDLSLQEISENLDISRQAVLDAIKKGSELLKNYENVLHLVEIKSSVDRSLDALGRGDADTAKEILMSLKENRWE